MQGISIEYTQSHFHDGALHHGEIKFYSKITQVYNPNVISGTILLCGNMKQEWNITSRLKKEIYFTIHIYQELVMP